MKSLADTTWELVDRYYREIKPETMLLAMNQYQHIVCESPMGPKMSREHSDLLDEKKERHAIILVHEVYDHNNHRMFIVSQTLMIVCSTREVRLTET